MTEILKFPNDSCSNAYRLYIATEKLGGRAQKLSTLETFIVEMTSASSEDRRRFVESWCTAYLDGEAISPLTIRNDEWMRLPLFRMVFRQILETGRMEGRAHYARWSAQLYGLFCRADGAYKEYQPTLSAMLAEAMRIDPSDGRARSLLISFSLSELDYFCHELPHGLLVERKILNERVAELEKLLSGTIWAERCKLGLAALRRIANGDWSQAVLDEAFRLLALRWRIKKSLLPKTNGDKFMG